MVYPRIHDPTLLEKDVNEEGPDRYNYPLEWPSSNTLHVEFSTLAAINALTSTFVLLLIISLLRSKRVRSNVFNMYLLAIAIPDFLVSFLCFWTCVLSAPGSEFFSEWMCGFQSFYLNWAFISNAWLNGVVVFQIHRMLRHSQTRRRYIPPTHKQVLGHALLVYTYACFWGFLCGFNIHFLPHSSHLYYGFACMPMEYDRASTLFFWLVYLPLTLGVPLVFACFVTGDILLHKLLPPTGKRRALSMFLLRLCFLYFAIWFPFLVLFLIGNFVVINPVVHWTGAAISHLQGLFSVLFCLTNPDIRRSFINLTTCQQDSADDLADDSALQSSNTRSVSQTNRVSRVQNWLRQATSRTLNTRGGSALSSTHNQSFGGNTSSAFMQECPAATSMELLESQMKNWNGRISSRNKSLKDDQAERENQKDDIIKETEASAPEQCPEDANELADTMQSPENFADSASSPPPAREDQADDTMDVENPNHVDSITDEDECNIIEMSRR